MFKTAIFSILFCLSLLITKAQTTDLSIIVEAQNLSGNTVSQVNIYEEFQYIITIINSGEAVSDATFSQIINPNLTVLNYISQNASGGASLVSGFDFTTDILSGTISNMPNNSSVEVKVLVRAPITLGGIATNATVDPPTGTSDTDTSNNQSIISIDINDLPIDFSVTYSQISPTQGSAITAWGDTVTYELTITNNSSVPFPLNYFVGRLNLESDPLFGIPGYQFESLTCMGGTNGMNCPDTSFATFTPTQIPYFTIFGLNGPFEFTVGGSLSFQAVYKYLEPACTLDLGTINIESHIFLGLNHTNESSNYSNFVLTPLIEAPSCVFSDICIETTQINPDPSQLVNWGEEVTFTSTMCNNGPLEVPMRFFLQNLSTNIEWDIISLSCIGTTGPITCSDFTLTDQGLFWESSVYTMPVNATIEVTTVAIFIDPDDCSTGPPQNSLGHIRSGVNLLSDTILDNNVINNAESDWVILPPLPLCEPEDIVDLSITKTQINPALPEGGDPFNTTSWGEITYEITATNPSETDALIAISDFIPQGDNQLESAMLVSVDCVSTTGTASCFTVNTPNIGVLLDGEPQDGELDVFWEILAEDNWSLPAQSSVTFHVVIDWQPNCSASVIRVKNKVKIESVDSITDNYMVNNYDEVSSYLAPCVDLIVQTYPEFTSVNVNQTFNWVVDITNSNTSSTAINIDFENILGPQFSISGTPICSVISGNASCITNFTTNDNTISANIPNMDTGSTIQITLPVMAPSFGGAFTNTAEATPNIINNAELTPETNISISNVQVIAPALVKSFIPDEIVVGQQSVLEFTINNVSGNPAQNNISFIDNFPDGMTLSGLITWVQDNGCTANFIGDLGDTAVEVSNLTFPSGISSCTFSVPVTSSIVGSYLNNNSNFSGQNNIDTSLASATLTVSPDNTNVDIEILKTVFPSEASIGDEVIFTITATNIGTTTATDISILESLPLGYNWISSTESLGVYDLSTSTWSIPLLILGQSETLTISAQVLSSNNLLNTASLESLNEIDRDESNNEDSAEVAVNDCLNIPSGMSPNNDGSNDLLIVPCLEDYPLNNLKIYNRYGALVYETDNYINDWNGIPNQGFPKSTKILPTGTYYYVLTIDSISKPLIGWIYLNH